MNDDHFLKRMFDGEDWEKNSSKNIFNLLGFFGCVAFGFVVVGVYEWVKGIDALEAATGVGQTSSDHLEHLGNFGSYLQGSVGSLWALAGFFILFVAFLIQAWQFAEQRKQNNRQNFDSRFFEMLGYYRQNVTEIGIGTKRTGRRVFVSLVREFRQISKIVDLACARVAPDYPRPRRLDLAYMAFYYGVGPNSTRVLKDDIDYHAEALVEEVVRKMEMIQRYYRRYAKEISDSDMPKVDRQKLEKKMSKLSRISYTPFDGHQSRLGHYFRHLFQLIKYLDEHAPVGTQNEYAGVLRAQLTNHEQALLCLNAMASIGAPWLKRGYLVKYALIKNIPRGFFNKKTELDLEKEFQDIRFEFMDGSDGSDAEPNR